MHPLAPACIIVGLMMLLSAKVPVLFRRAHVPNPRRAIGVPCGTRQHAAPELVTLHVGEVFLHMLLVT